MVQLNSTLVSKYHKLKRKKKTKDIDFCAALIAEKMKEDTFTDHLIRDRVGSFENFAQSLHHSEETLKLLQIIGDLLTTKRPTQEASAQTDPFEGELILDSLDAQTKRIEKLNLQISEIMRSNE